MGPDRDGPGRQCMAARNHHASSSYSQNEILNTGHRFFGSVSQGLANVIEGAFRRSGRPNGYILGEDAGSPFLPDLAMARVCPRSTSSHRSTGRAILSFSSAHRRSPRRWCLSTTCAIHLKSVIDSEKYQGLRLRHTEASSVRLSEVRRRGTRAVPVQNGASLRCQRRLFEVYAQSNLESVPRVGSNWWHLGPGRRRTLVLRIRLGDGRRNSSPTGASGGPARDTLGFCSGPTRRWRGLGRRHWVRVQSAMLVALGFLLAALVPALFVAPAYRRHAVRLTTDAVRQLDAADQGPVRGDKDKLHAGYAITIHPFVRTKVQEGALVAARLMVELNRHNAGIRTSKAGDADAHVAQEHENARRVLEQTVTDRLPKVERGSVKPRKCRSTATRNATHPVRRQAEQGVGQSCRSRRSSATKSTGSMPRSPLVPPAIARASAIPA